MNKTTYIISAVSLLAITGIAVVDTQAHQDDSNNSCEIAKTISNGMLKLESRYNHENAGSGSYKVSIRTLAGSNNVNSTQRGEFSKKAGESVVLSKAQLSAYGQAYEVKLDVTFNGKRHKCSEKIKPTI